eukprot:TRINITY_DN22476_c0_g1_i1.p1 TRINITY_DN22476_c0_g1~~TRINITY_DN22476_c0_g1_i1.p1  ORF type:complete len:599 (-),score=181.25 TRINITY_DN22476_c0_g1_i1:127-1887(-)
MATSNRTMGFNALMLVFMLVQVAGSASFPETAWAGTEIVRRMFNIPQLHYSANGGVPCIACTGVTGILEQLAQIDDGGIVAVLDKVCGYFPAVYQPECAALVKAFGPALIVMIENRETPDQICHDLLFCPNKTCHLYPLPKEPRVPHDYSSVVAKARDIFERGPRALGVPERVWPWNQVADHKPFFDDDDDWFSQAETLRGYDWRGADCDDHDPTIYPGRRDTTHPPEIDHDCNGIYGVDNVTGKSWEELLCSGSQHFGSILLGDSAGAHFHVPPQWLNASEVNADTFRNLLDILENELCWPELSAASGFTNNTWMGRPVGPVDSGYLRMRQDNLCVHRDYQNQAVSGARSGAMANDIVKTLKRNHTDHPVFAVYALIGNDVCDWRASYTPLDEFYKNVLTALSYLDTVLNPGSHVAILGLVDGRILYDTMGDRVHPLGALHGNVLYSDFYDMMNCLQISPCFGWMNTDAAIRNETSAWAAQLNNVYKQLIANNTFRNFDVTYFDCPMQEVIDLWASMGGVAHDLIELVDGFHPNQIAEWLTTEVMWPKYVKAGLVPAANPNNAKILSLFGDQGGYVPDQRNNRRA